MPEQYAGEVCVGQPVRLATRAHPEMTFHGKITRINPSVDPTNRTFQVETVRAQRARTFATRAVSPTHPS